MFRFLVLLIVVSTLLFGLFTLFCEQRVMAEDKTEAMKSIHNFTQKVNPALSDEQSWLIARAIVTEATKSGVDDKLIAAVIAKESSFRYDAVSNMGAVGFGQLMPTTAKSLGVKDRYAPYENIAGTSKYLKQLLHRFRGDKALAIASYYQGPTSVSSKGVFRESVTYVLGVAKLYDQID